MRAGVLVKPSVGATFMIAACWISLSACSAGGRGDSTLADLAQQGGAWNLRSVPCGDVFGAGADGGEWPGECYLAGVPDSLGASADSVEAAVRHAAHDVSQGECRERGEAAPVVSCLFFSPSDEGWNKVYVSVFPLADTVHPGTGLTVWIDQTSEAPGDIIARLDSLGQ